MTRIEEEHVTTTTTREEEPAKPHVDNINLNVSEDAGETITVNHPDDKTSTTRTQTTRTEVHETD
jgi:hypothetical protein